MRGGSRNNRSRVCGGCARRTTSFSKPCPRRHSSGRACIRSAVRSLCGSCWKHTRSTWKRTHGRCRRFATNTKRSKERKEEAALGGCRNVLAGVVSERPRFGREALVVACRLPGGRQAGRAVHWQRRISQGGGVRGGRARARGN